MKYKIGNLFFKLRTFTPVPLILAVIFFRPHQAGSFNWLVITLSVIFVIGGEVIRIYVVGYSFEGTSGRETYLRADKINKYGIYSLLKNPLYLGNLIIYNGLIILIFNPILFIIMNIFFIIQYYFIILSEEKFLEKKYGKEYLDYKNATNKIIPKFKNFKKAEGYFQSTKVLYKEVDSIFNIIILFIMFLLYKNVYFYGYLKNPLLFCFFGGFFILIYTFLRIKKAKYKKEILKTK